MYGRLEKQYTETDEGKDLLAEYEYSTEFPMSAKVTNFTGTDNQHDGLVETRVFVDGMGRGIHSVQSALNTSYPPSFSTNLQTSLYVFAISAGSPDSRPSTNDGGSTQDSILPP